MGNYRQGVDATQPPVDYLGALMAEERVMVFIDGSNFYRCLKSQFEMTNVDFFKWRTLLSTRVTLGTCARPATGSFCWTSR